MSNGTAQYNELCRTHWGGDAEGVEIDALNENFAVLYNYSHHNSGGFVQFCTPANLPSYDSYYAYNISENDGTYGPRPNSNSLIMPFAAAMNCSVFNNTVYFDPFPAQDNNGADRFFNDNSSNVQSVAIYNNIFYRGGNAYQFNSGEINYFNNKMESLADDNVVPDGGNTRFANNLFYNFDTTSINPDSAFYQDNIWGVDPKLADPGTMGDGNADALLKENDITKAWKLDAYKLAEDSPAIGAGRAIRTEYVNLKDMLGNTVDAQKPDLGAIQYTPPVDKSSLQTLVNTSEQYYNQLDRYTPESARAFKAAYEEAMRVLADANADDAAVKAAHAALEEAVKGLVEQGGTIDRGSLQTLVDTSEQYYNQLDRYTPESAQAFKAAYEEAMRVLTDANADDAAVRAAYAALEAASKGLVEQGGTDTPGTIDKSSLQTLVDTSEQYYNQLDRYTPETAQAFKAAYEEAMRVLADANADDAAVRAAYAALEAASKGLVEQAEHPEHPEQAEHLQRTINKRKAKTAHPQAGPYRQGITAHRVLRQRQRRCLQAEQFWLYW